MPARAFSSETTFLEHAAAPTTSTQTPASCNKRFEITLMTTNSCLFIVLVPFHSDIGDTCFEIGSFVQHRSKRPIIRLTTKLSHSRGSLLPNATVAINVHIILQTGRP